MRRDFENVAGLEAAWKWEDIVKAAITLVHGEITTRGPVTTMAILRRNYRPGMWD